MLINKKKHVSNVFAQICKMFSKYPTVELFVHFEIQELFQIDFFTLVPLRDVHTIVILK